MELYNNDCLVTMRKMVEDGVQVDSLISDPPFGMSYQSNARKDKHKEIANDDNLDWLPEFAELSYKIAKEDTAHYIFCSWHFVDIFKQEFQKYFTLKNILVWNKGNPGMGDLGTFGTQTEFILFLTKGKRDINGRRDGNVLEFSRTQNNLHPTEKPVDLLKYMISKVTNEGDVVFDPFFGSGSCGVACAQIHRDFIGCELDEDYFKESYKRIKKAYDINISEDDEW